MDCTKTIQNSSVVIYCDRLWQDNKGGEEGGTVEWCDLIMGRGEGVPLWASKGQVIKGMWVWTWRSGGGVGGEYFTQRPQQVRRSWGREEQVVVEEMKEGQWAGMQRWEVSVWRWGLGFILRARWNLWRHWSYKVMWVCWALDCWVLAPAPPVTSLVTLDKLNNWHFCFLLCKMGMVIASWRLWRSDTFIHFHTFHTGTFIHFHCHIQCEICDTFWLSPRVHT